MSDHHASKPLPESVSWSAVLRELYEGGPATARMLATGFGTTEGAVRNHCNRMEESGLVESIGSLANGRKSGGGVALRVWAATAQGRRFMRARAHALQYCRQVDPHGAQLRELLEEK